MKIEISTGELVDKVSILAIKLAKIESPEKLKNVKKEYSLLQDDMQKLGITTENSDYRDLVEVNTALWDIENGIRAKELKKEFDDDFISFARSVYFHNDKRAQIKRRINEKTESGLVEEKEYTKY
jgi:hypothetical protein